MIQGRMRKDLYKELHRVEDQHWWHRHKRTVVHQLTRRFAQKGKVLDVGAGTGKMLLELKLGGWQTAGLDGEKEAIRWSKKRGINIKLCDLEKGKFPFSSNQFDLVLALDILEHIKNEELVLKEIRRVLKPRGIMIATTPSYQWLFSYWDKLLGHQRRYTRSLLEKRIKKTGLKIRYLTYFFSLHLLPAILVRFIKQSGTKKTQTISDFENTPLSHISIFILEIYAKVEQWLLRYLSLPFGLSLVGVFEK